MKRKKNLGKTHVSGRPLIVNERHTADDLEARKAGLLSDGDKVLEEMLKMKLGVHYTVDCHHMLCRGPLRSASSI